MSGIRETERTRRRKAELKANVQNSALNAIEAINDRHAAADKAEAQRLRALDEREEMEVRDASKYIERVHDVDMETDLKSGLKRLIVLMDELTMKKRESVSNAYREPLRIAKRKYSNGVKLLVEKVEAESGKKAAKTVAKEYADMGPRKFPKSVIIIPAIVIALIIIVPSVRRSIIDAKVNKCRHEFQESLVAGNLAQAELTLKLFDGHAAFLDEHIELTKAYLANDDIESVKNLLAYCNSSICRKLARDYMIERDKYNDAEQFVSTSNCGEYLDYMKACVSRMLAAGKKTAARDFVRRKVTIFAGQTGMYAPDKIKADFNKIINSI